MPDPLIKLDPNGKAPVLSYDVPEPTSYSGAHGIVLDLGEEEPPQAIFSDLAFQIPADAKRRPIGELTTITDDEVTDAIRLGDRRIFPNIVNPAATSAFLFSGQVAVRRDDRLDIATTSVLARGLRDRAVTPKLDVLTEATVADGQEGPRSEVRESQTQLPPAVRGSVLTGPALASQGVRPGISEVEIETIAAQLRAGKRLNVYRSLSGEYVHSFLPEPQETRPQIVLVETYRLSSFLGQFGAGRVLNTFSLLPGEKTTISVKTFRKTEADSKSASSILDSFTKESADDFETSLQQEQSDKQAQQDSFEYHAEAEASASWGWGSAKVSGGVKGGTASQREEFAKITSNAVNKHAAKASSKRDVQVNTASEVKTESGEETSITRQLENINVGRVLNFVFRQMNQEHITILHLVDVRVAFWNGFAESVEEVPLPRLDALLSKYVRPDHQEKVRSIIRAQLDTLFDYEDKPVDPPFVEERSIAGGDKYLRVRRDLVSVYEDETGNRFSVPGVIVNVSKITMRTEGVIVDAILGEGNALDDYSQGLQESAVKQRELENQLREEQLKREELARDIVSDTDKKDRAKTYAILFRKSVELPGKITVSASDEAVKVSTLVDASPNQDRG